MAKMFSLWVFVIFVFDCFEICNTATISDTVLSNSVLLTFSNVSLDEWHRESKTSIMTEIIANLSTEYCAANPEQCKISSVASTNFKSENVKTVDSYPQNSKDGLVIFLYVEIPRSAGPPFPKIPADTLRKILTDNKANLSSKVGYDVGSIVLRENSANSDGKKVDDQLNRVMIPIAFLLLVVISLIAWLLHRGHMKKKAREERKRYIALKNSKSGSNLRAYKGAMVNTADVPSTEFSEKPESGRKMPESMSPESQAEDEVNYNVRRHKKRRALPKKPPIRKAPEIESDDVCDDDSDGREKSKKKGRRRKGRRSYNVNRDRYAGEECEMKAAKELACSQGSSEGINGESQVNTGYQRDSEKGESDAARMSNTDSAVELNSSVASSANHNRARNLPPISRGVQNEA